MATYYKYIIEKITLDGVFVEYIRDGEDNIIEYEYQTIDQSIRDVVEDGFYYSAKLIYRKE